MSEPKSFTEVSNVCLADLDGANALPAVNEADLRFLRWLAFRCSAFGTEVGRISVVIARLHRRGLIDVFGRKVALCGAGWAVLFRTGYPLDQGPEGDLRDTKLSR